MNALGKLLAGMATAAGVLLAAEGVLRLLDLPDRGLYDGDPAALWWLRPNLAPRQVPFAEEGTTFTVRTNAAGFRGGPPPPNPFVFLGDSTTFGWGVEEEQALPGAFATRTGAPVVNAGVPGYSTVQGLATIDRVVALHPRRVIVGYLVRDAERSTHPDDPAAVPRPPEWNLVRLLRGALPRPDRPPGDVFRVPPADFGKNLVALREALHGADVFFLAFPMVDPAPEHVAAMLAVAPDALVPTLPREDFFPHDPLHLTVEGNRALADELATALSY